MNKLPFYYYFFPSVTNSINTRCGIRRKNAKEKKKTMCGCKKCYGAGINRFKKETKIVVVRLLNNNTLKNI